MVDRREWTTDITKVLQQGLVEVVLPEVFEDQSVSTSDLLNPTVFKLYDEIFDLTIEIKIDPSSRSPTLRNTHNLNRETW